VRRQIVWRRTGRGNRELASFYFRGGGEGCEDSLRVRLQLHPPYLIAHILSSRTLLIFLCSALSRLAGWRGALAREEQEEEGEGEEERASRHKFFFLHKMNNCSYYYCILLVTCTKQS
jgi:hypothetical protein